MSALSIPLDESGLIRVFAINRPIPDMSRALKSKGKAALAADLLGQALPEDGLELFPVTDLAGIGLPAYLADGYAIEPSDISRDRRKLDGLDGFVLLLFSAAFDGAAAQLFIGPDLTLIGTYAEPRADQATIVLDSDAAQPYSGTPPPPQAAPPKGRAGSFVVAIGLITLVGLLIWWMMS